MISLRTLFTLAAVVMAARASAQTSPRPITLDEAVALARRNAIEVIQATGQVRTAAAGVRSAYAAFLPSLSLSAGLNRQLPAGGTTRVENGQIVTVAQEPWSSSMGLGANVVLFDGGQRIFDLGQAKARREAASIDQTSAQFAVTLSAKQQFYNVLAARESQAAAAAQLEQAEQQRKTSIARAKARVATRSDSLRAEIQVRNAQVAVTSAANDLESANASLTRAVGSPTPVTATEGSNEAPSLSLDEAALRALVEDGPAVRSARASLEIAQAAQRSSWAGYLPSINLGYSRSGSGIGNTFGGDEFSYSGGLRFSLSLPLFNQLQRESQVTQAQVQRANAEAAVRDARLSSIESLTQSLGAFRAAGERVTLQAASVTAAEEDLRVQQQRYAGGGSTLLDVLTSQTQLDQARRDLIRARYDQRVAKAQIESLVGREL